MERGIYIKFSIKITDIFKTSLSTKVHSQICIIYKNFATAENSNLLEAIFTNKVIF